MLDDFLKIYRGKKVLITGNTGFKGSWMSQWLLNIGADVYGMALEPPTNPSLFDQLALRKHCKWYDVDIRNYKNVEKVLAEVNPEFVFHLAAQTLIRYSYDFPYETFETNMMGTVNILEAIRQQRIQTNVIVVTTDKCYENKEWLYGYRETDPLGGYDPYSASKGAVEIIVSSYRRSFFNPSDFEKHGVKLSSVRAGNVIGGGDWATDRIVPDCIRFLSDNKPIQVRNPGATRPWQHVLEPVGGYLILGSKLYSSVQKELEQYCDAFNFGPAILSNRTVQELVFEVIRNWGSGEINIQKEEAVHEAQLLNISIEKAYNLLNWHPVWGFEETVKNTVLWYKELLEIQDGIIELTNFQIKKYMNEFRFTNKTD